ncbi:MAG: hypothetical protein AB1758_09680, partial [Candidatus Eremiobacterota bacterium]
EGENWFDLGLSPAQIARRDELIAGQRAGTLTEAEHEELNILLLLAAGERDRRYGLLIDGLMRDFIQNSGITPAQFEEFGTLGEQSATELDADERARLAQLRSLMAPLHLFRTTIMNGLIGNTRHNFDDVYFDLMYGFEGDPAEGMTMFLDRCSVVERMFMIPPDALNLADMAIQQGYARDLAAGQTLSNFQMEFLSQPTNSEGLLGEFRRQQLYREGMLAELEANPQTAATVAAELGVTVEDLFAILMTQEPSDLSFEHYLVYDQLMNPMLPPNPEAYAAWQRLAVLSASAVSFYESEGTLAFDIALADAQNRRNAAWAQLQIDRTQVNRAAEERDRGTPIAEWLYNRGADIFQWTGEEDITTYGGGELSSDFSAYASAIQALDDNIARLEELRAQLRPGMSWEDRQELMLLAGATQDSAGFAQYRGSHAANTTELELVGQARTESMTNAQENLGEYLNGVMITSYTLEGITSAIGMGVFLWTGGAAGPLLLGALGGAVGGGTYRVLENLAAGNPNLLANVPGGVLRGGVTGLFAIGGTLIANSLRAGGSSLLAQMTARYGFGTFLPTSGQTLIETGDIRAALIAGIFSTVVDAGGDTVFNILGRMFRGADGRIPTPDELRTRLREAYGLTDADIDFVLYNRNPGSSRLSTRLLDAEPSVGLVNTGTRAYQPTTARFFGGGDVDIPLRDYEAIRALPAEYRVNGTFEVVGGSQNARIYRWVDSASGEAHYFTVAGNSVSEGRVVPLNNYEQISNITFPRDRLVANADPAHADAFLQMWATHGQFLAAQDFNGANIYFQEVIEPALRAVGVDVTRAISIAGRSLSGQASSYSPGQRRVAYDGLLHGNMNRMQSQAFVFQEEFGHFIQDEYAGGPLGFAVSHETDILAVPTLAQLSDPDFVVRIPAAGAPGGELVIPGRNFLNDAHLHADRLGIPLDQRVPVTLDGTTYYIPPDWFNTAQNLANLTPSNRAVMFAANGSTMGVYNRTILSAAYEVDVMNMMYFVGLDPTQFVPDFYSYHPERMWNLPTQ